MFDLRPQACWRLSLYISNNVRKFYDIYEIMLIFKKKSIISVESRSHEWKLFLFRVELMSLELSMFFLLSQKLDVWVRGPYLKPQIMLSIKKLAQHIIFVSWAFMKAQNFLSRYLIFAIFRNVLEYRKGSKLV